MVFFDCVVFSATEDLTRAEVAMMTTTKKLVH